MKRLFVMMVLLLTYSNMFSQSDEKWEWVNALPDGSEIFIGEVDIFGLRRLYSEYDKVLGTVVEREGAGSWRMVIGFTDSHQARSLRYYNPNTEKWTKPSKAMCWRTRIGKDVLVIMVDDYELSTRHAIMVKYVDKEKRIVKSRGPFVPRFFVEEPVF